jgi:hypothetical protein
MLREDGPVPPMWAAATDQPPTGAAYDIVLLLHVACVVVGLVTVVVSWVQAARLRRLSSAAPLPDPLRTYYSAGTNWAGRVLFGVPVFGFALLGMSKGAFGLRDGWVLGGLALWAVAAVVAELSLWPAERRLATAVGVAAPAPDRPGAAATVGAASDATIEDGTVSWAGDCRQVVTAAAAVVAVLLAASVLMVVQP